MATKKSTTASRPARNRVSKEVTVSRPKGSPATPNLTLEDIIEEERARLMKAHSILSVIITAMEDADVSDSDGPYWPAVIESACDLINESIRRLEDLDYSPKPAPRRGYEVRDDAPNLGYGSRTRSEPLSTSDGDDWPLVSNPTEAERSDLAAAIEPLSKKH